MVSVTSFLARGGLLLLGVSHAVRTYLDYRRAGLEGKSEPPGAGTHGTAGGAESADEASPETSAGGDAGTAVDQPVSQEVLDRERVRSYREILDAMIRLNREVVALGEEELREQADIMAHGGETDLDELHADVAQAYQSRFHIISPAVRKAVSEYTDYLVTYHDDGAKAGDLLELSGQVTETMRDDLGLESLFDHPSQEVDTDPTPDVDTDLGIEFEDDDVEYPPNEELGTDWRDDDPSDEQSANPSGGSS